MGHISSDADGRRRCGGSTRVQRRDLLWNAFDHPLTHTGATGVSTTWTYGGDYVLRSTIPPCAVTSSPGQRDWRCPVPFRRRLV